MPRKRVFIAALKLVKQQINGNDRLVLKEDATLDDLQAEAKHFERTLGYTVEANGTGASYLLSHPFYRGKFLLRLESESS